MSEEQNKQSQDAGSVQPEASPQEIEKLEEAKLKAKYPLLPGGPPPMRGHSSFLQKRLAKGMFFSFSLFHHSIQTTNNKMCLGQKFFDSGDYQMAKQKMGGINKPPLKVPGPIFPTGDAIPTPETVPTRKTSLVQPSKLAAVPAATTPTSLGPNIV